MGRERRNKNGLYYYRKVRRGRRVFSEYIPAQAVKLVEQLAMAERARRTAALRQRQDFEAADAAAERAIALGRAMSADILTGAGYHQHKGQWRRKSERA